MINLYVGNYNLNVSNDISITDNFNFLNNC